MADQTVRTRFAPSPTGFMHVGGVRTALFAWLIARSHNGEFLLRIEDTDKAREVAGSVDHIIEALDWLGLERDEGPRSGGDNGPYLQSERLEIYKHYVETLLQDGRAYADPFSIEQVTEFRELAKSQKRPFLFRDYRPETTDTPDDWFGNVSIRFKTEEVRKTTWRDEVRGELSAGEEALDDFVIMKSDGYPTYNFAHVIDDHLMNISHVVRGEEFLPSVPKFLSLMDALSIPHPKFVTVPPILNANGGKKLSKRDGAKDILDYRADGYTADVIINFLASLGWNDGTEKEVYTRDELVEAFDVARIQRSGAKFDETKLEWLDWQHSLSAIQNNAIQFLSDRGYDAAVHNAEFALLAASKSRNRADFRSQYDIYATSPSISLESFDLSIIDKSLNRETAETYIEQTIELLTRLSDCSASSVEAALRAQMEQLGAQPRAYLNLIRWAITNAKVSPNLFEMIALIGQAETIDRLRRAL